MTTPIRIRSFRASNLAEALSRIRNELGPEAAILETKQFRRFLPWSKKRFEIVASSTGEHLRNSIDEPAQTALQTVDYETESKHQSTDDDASIETMAAVPVGTAPPSQPLLSPTLSNVPCTNFSKSFIELYHDLVERNIEASIALDWIEAARELLGDEIDNPIAIRSLVASWIRSALTIEPPASQWNDSQRIVGVVGSSGVGKTSAIAKMAALASQEMQLNVGVLSIDADNRLSRESLQQYCSLMGWRFERADSKSCFDREMDQLSSCDVIFVDTPAIAINDFETLKFIRSLFDLNFGTKSNLQMHVVVPATMSGSLVKRTLQWFEAVSPTHVLLTKVDEALGIGGLFSTLVECRIPLGFMCQGRKIPSDIVQASAGSIADSLLSE